MKKIVIILLLVAMSTPMWLQAKSADPRDDYFYKSGIEAFDNEEYTDAEDWFKKEVKDNPKNGYAHTYLSMIHGLITNNKITN